MSMDDLLENPTHFNIAKILLEPGSLLMFRGFCMAVQVTGQSWLLARDGQESVAKYTAYSAWEALIFIVIFESLQAVNTKIAAVAVNESSEGKQQVGKMFQQGVFYALGLFTFSAVAALAAPIVYRSSGETAEVNAGVQSYFLLALIYYFFDTLYRVHIRAMIGLEKERSTVVADLSEGVLNLGLTAFFVLGAFKLGVNGAALGYGAAAFLTLLGYHAYLRGRDDLDGYALFKLQRPYIDWSTLKEMMLNGAYWSANALLKYVALALMTLCLGRFGNDTLAALAPAQAYYLFLTYIIDGFSSIPISHLSALKENTRADAELIRRVAFVATGISFGLTLLVGAFVWLLSPKFIDLFLPSTVSSCGSTCELAEEFLKVQIIAQILLNTGNMCGYSLIASGAKRYATNVTIGAFFVLNVGALLLTQFAMHGSALAVYATQLIGVFAACIFNGGRMALYRQEDKTTETEVSCMSVTSRLFGYLRKNAPSDTVVSRQDELAL